MFSSFVRERPRATQTCPFLKIPYDIRLMIYELLLASDEDCAIYITTADQSIAHLDTRLTGMLCKSEKDVREGVRLEGTKDDFENALEKPVKGDSWSPVRNAPI